MLAHNCPEYRTRDEVMRRHYGRRSAIFGAFHSPDFASSLAACVRCGFCYIIPFHTGKYVISNVITPFFLTHPPPPNLTSLLVTELDDMTDEVEEGGEDDGVISLWRMHVAACCDAYLLQVLSWECSLASLQAASRDGGVYSDVMLRESLDEVRQQRSVAYSLVSPAHSTQSALSRPRELAQHATLAGALQVHQAGDEHPPPPINPSLCYDLQQVASAEGEGCHNVGNPFGSIRPQAPVVEWEISHDVPLHAFALCTLRNGMMQCRISEGDASGRVWTMLPYQLSHLTLPPTETGGICYPGRLVWLGDQVWKLDMLGRWDGGGLEGTFIPESIDNLPAAWRAYYEQYAVILQRGRAALAQWWQHSVVECHARKRESDKSRMQLQLQQGQQGALQQPLGLQGLASWATAPLSPGGTPPLVRDAANERGNSPISQEALSSTPSSDSDGGQEKYQLLSDDENDQEEELAEEDDPGKVEEKPWFDRRICIKSNGGGGNAQEESPPSDYIPLE